MVSNINLFASAQVSKANSSKKSDFMENQVDKTYSFKDNLKAAARSIVKNDNSSVRKEMVNRSENKLSKTEKPNSPVEEDNESKGKAKEKQLEKVVNKLEELLLSLQELKNLQQSGEVPTEEQTAMLEGIKEAFQDLTAFQNKLTKLENLQLQTEIPELQTKLAEFGTLLEGVLSELKADSALINANNNSGFPQKLQAVVEETLSKLEAISNASIEAVNADLNSNATTAVIGQDIVSEAQNPQENIKSNTEADQAGENTEELNGRLKPTGAESKGAIRENISGTEKATEEEAALNGKVEKVSVEGKENRRQDAGTENGEEAPKGAPMSANAKQSKPVNGAVNPVGYEQTVIDDSTEIVTTQADAPKTQTLSKTELINQIVKKAELVITDAQTEMRMQLEPENLGRLTLKIAVEKGIITAKFTAESYEVKKVIESSFNELKDMLQEQGLEVQNFSVSVGQDNREYDKGSAFQQWKETVKLNGSSMKRGGYEGYLDTESAASRVVNPYSVHNGEFDHTA